MVVGEIAEAGGGARSGALSLVSVEASGGRYLGDSRVA